MDDQQRIALARLGNAHPHDSAPVVQFHLGDHLGSSNVVVDLGGVFVNREEFTPYGETSFGSFAKKRFRFTGKEKDEESSLGYHGGRYLSHYLGRWLTCDPITAAPSKSAYEYSNSSPINFVDPTGNDANEDTLVAGRPIHRGVADLTIQNWETKEIYTGGDRGSRYEWEDNSYDIKTQAGLESFIKERVGPTLTDFEQYLIDNWNKFPGRTILTPIVQIGSRDFAGYILEYSEGSAKNIVLTYDKIQNSVSRYQWEPPLVKMGLGPIDFALGARGISRLGSSLIKGAYGVTRSTAKQFLANLGAAKNLSFGRKLDFLFNRNINQANDYNRLRAAGNHQRIGIADTPANRAEVMRRFNQAYNNPSSIVGPGSVPGSTLREFFLPGVTSTGSKIQFVEKAGQVITIIAK